MCPPYTKPGSSTFGKYDTLCYCYHSRSAYNSTYSFQLLDFVLTTLFILPSIRGLPLGLVPSAFTQTGPALPVAVYFFSSAMWSVSNFWAYTKEHCSHTTFSELLVNFDCRHTCQYKPLLSIITVLCSVLLVGWIGHKILSTCVGASHCIHRKSTDFLVCLTCIGKEVMLLLSMKHFLHSYVHVYMF